MREHWLCSATFCSLLPLLLLPTVLLSFVSPTLAARQEPPDPQKWLKQWQRRALQLMQRDPPDSLPRYIAPTTLPPRSLIPNFIFQTWKSATPAGPQHAQAVRSFSSLNSDYHFMLFDDAAALNFMCTFHPRVAPIYQAFLPGAPKSDLWRLAVLHTFGGVYVDTDSLARIPFSSFLWGNVSIASGVDYNGELHQWLILSSPVHPLIGSALALAASRAAQLYLSRQAWKPASVIHTTGPGAFNAAILEGLGDSTCGRLLRAVMSAKRRARAGQREEHKVPASGETAAAVAAAEALLSSPLPLPLPPCVAGSMQIYPMGLSECVKFKADGVGGSPKGRGEMYKDAEYYHVSERRWETLFRRSSSSDNSSRAGGECGWSEKGVRALIGADGGGWGKLDNV